MKYNDQGSVEKTVDHFLARAVPYMYPVIEPQAHYDQLLRWWYYGLEVSGAECHKM